MPTILEGASDADWARARAAADAEDEARWYDSAVFCESCDMWLNGPTQMEDHKLGKKHKKNEERKEKIAALVRTVHRRKILPDFIPEDIAVRVMHFCEVGPGANNSNV